MHIILVTTYNGQLSATQYLDSKFDRELGETVRVDGVAMKVGVIASTRKGALSVERDLVTEHNARTRKESKRLARSMAISAFPKSEIQEFINIFTHAI